MVDEVTLANMPAHVLDELVRRGVDLRTLARVVDVHRDEALLLTGSYATGEANPTSDLDFLVLSGSRRPEAPDGASNHPSIFGDSFDVQLGDLTVNIEYVARDWALALGTVVDAVRESAHAKPCLPNLQALEVRLVQRIATGIPLSGRDVVEQLRARLDVSTVHASSAALNFVMAISLLEDTRVLAPPMQQVMFRGAGEALLLAAVNAFGPITYDVKHLYRRATKLAALADMPRVFAERERVLFADRLTAEEGTELLVELASDLYDAFHSERCPPLILPMLQPFWEQWRRAGIVIGQ